MYLLYNFSVLKIDNSSYVFECNMLLCLPYVAVALLKKITFYKIYHMFCLEVSQMTLYPKKTGSFHKQSLSL